MPTIARHKSDKKDKMSNKLGSVLSIRSYTGRGGRQEKKKKNKKFYCCLYCLWRQSWYIQSQGNMEGAILPERIGMH